MERVTITKEKLMTAMVDASKELLSEVDDEELNALFVIYTGIVFAKVAVQLFDEEN